LERKPPEDPPCENCRVELQEENQEAAQIYMITRNQLIVGPQGIIDINHLAIHANMELYEVKDRKRCFEKVVTLFHELRKEQNEN
jgi:ABC-type branched-subunit amino acid transport system ATPase component